MEITETAKLIFMSILAIVYDFKKIVFISFIF